MSRPHRLDANMRSLSLSGIGRRAVPDRILYDTVPPSAVRPGSAVRWRVASRWMAR